MDNELMKKEFINMINFISNEKIIIDKRDIILIKQIILCILKTKERKKLKNIYFYIKKLES